MGFFDKNSLFCCTWQPLIRTCILGIKKGDFRKKIFFKYCSTYLGHIGPGGIFVTRQLSRVERVEFLHR